MPSQKLIAVVTALLFFGGPGHGQATLSIEQLLQIEEMILNRDCAALRGFLAVNPQIARGNDPLAVELRNFADAMDRGLINCLSASDGITTQQNTLSNSLAATY